MKHLSTRLSADRERRRAQSAFSMIEVIVGMGLVAMTVGALFTGLTFGVQRTNDTREDLRATQIMLEKMEQVRLYRWEQIAYLFDPDDYDDLEFDPDDPHLPEDELTPFIVPATFTASLKSESTIASDLVYQGTLIVTNAPISSAYSNQNVMIKVGVTWESGGKTKSREMQTLFAKNGIQVNIPE